MNRARFFAPRRLTLHSPHFYVMDAYYVYINLMNNQSKNEAWQAESLAAFTRLQSRGGDVTIWQPIVKYCLFYT